MVPCNFGSKTFLATREVAELLQVTTRTIRLWAELSEIPAVRIGRQWRFRPLEISAWLAERVNSVTGSPTPEPPVDGLISSARGLLE